MNFEFDNNSPSYLQICEQLRLQIISGTLASGERLPSVRDLALTLKVNPNTLQKALAELESIGLIFTERTNGKFVTVYKSLIESQRMQYADNITKNYLQNMACVGFSFDEALEHLKSKKGEQNGND